MLVVSVIQLYDAERSRDPRGRGRTGSGWRVRNRYRGEQLNIVSAFALISRAVKVYAADEISTGRLNAQKIAVDALMAANLILNTQVSCQFG